jgi:hypothetical protein
MQVLHSRQPQALAPGLTGARQFGVQLAGASTWLRSDGTKKEERGDSKLPTGKLSVPW